MYMLKINQVWELTTNIDGKFRLKVNIYDIVVVVFFWDMKTMSNV